MRLRDKDTFFLFIGRKIVSLHRETHRHNSYLQSTGQKTVRRCFF